MRWITLAGMVVLVVATAAQAAAPGFTLKKLHRLGGAADDGAAYVAVASDGSTYVAFSRGPVMPGSAGEPPNRDVVLTKYARSGAVAWERTFGGSRSDDVGGIATGADGSVYVAGYTLSTDFAAQANAGAEDLFVARYDAFGNPLWTRLAGGEGRDFAQGVAVGPSVASAIYVAGWSESPTIGDQVNAGDSDALIARFQVSGKLSWVRLAGTPRADVAQAISVAASSAIFVAGYAQPRRLSSTSRS